MFIYRWVGLWERCDIDVDVNVDDINDVDVDVDVDNYCLLIWAGLVDLNAVFVDQVIIFDWSFCLNDGVFSSKMCDIDLDLNASSRTCGKVVIVGAGWLWVGIGLCSLFSTWGGRERWKVELVIECFDPASCCLLGCRWADQVRFKQQLHL